MPPPSPPWPLLELVAIPEDDEPFVVLPLAVDPAGLPPIPLDIDPEVVSEPVEAVVPLSPQPTASETPASRVQMRLLCFNPPPLRGALLRATIKLSDAPQETRKPRENPIVQ